MKDVFVIELIAVSATLITAVSGYLVNKIKHREGKEKFLNEQLYTLIEENKEERKKLREDIESLTKANDALRLDVITLKENNGLLRNEVAQLTFENEKLRLEISTLKDELSNRRSE